MLSTINTDEVKRQRKLAILWGVTFMIAFPLLITLGLLMRSSQAEIATIGPDRFYVYMTLHGLGMVSVLFSIAFSGLWYFISTRYLRLNLKIGYFVYTLVIIGLLALTISTLIGKYGPGWYLLYPLPFINAPWPEWSIGLSSAAIIVMGIGWLIGSLHMLHAMSVEYDGFFNLLGWQYLGRKPVKRELPTVILIATISLIPGIFAVIAGAVFLIMFIMKIFEPSLNFDVLMMKNLVMYFGHAIANITMYCAVGWVYMLFPEFSGRELKVDKVLVISWNATFIFIVFAFFHHMYMDFGQPLSFQYFGQIISYLSAVPATGVTMFSVMSQIYHSKIKWGIVPLMFLFGTAGWAIGGFSAVVDSTIYFNKVLHNTLWVPAHFHTYMIMGVVLFILGYLFYLFSSKENLGGGWLGKGGFWVFVVGAYGFLLMFYLGGMHSIPRRYNSYANVQLDPVSQTGAHLAYIAVFCIILVLIGLLIMYVALIKNLIQNKDQVQPK